MTPKFRPTLGHLLIELLVKSGPEATMHDVCRAKVLDGQWEGRQILIPAFAPYYKADPERNRFWVSIKDVIAVEDVPFDPKEARTT